MNGLSTQIEPVGQGSGEIRKPPHAWYVFVGGSTVVIVVGGEHGVACARDGAATSAKKSRKGSIFAKAMMRFI